MLKEEDGHGMIRLLLAMLWFWGNVLDEPFGIDVKR